MMLAKQDGKRHDFVVGMTHRGTGICLHSNSVANEAAVRALEVHCAKRKYAQRTSRWFGVSVGLNAGMQFGVTLEFPWERSPTMDELTRGMKSYSSLGKAMKTVSAPWYQRNLGAVRDAPVAAA